MTLKRRILTATAAIIVLTGLGLATPSPASAAAAPHGTSSAAVIQPAGKPTGCSSGFFCGWVGTNGNGNNCADIPYYLNAPTWVSSPRWGHIATAFNNSYAYSGCDVIRLYYLPNYSGAWNDLGRGDYYLDMSKNKFEGVGLQGVGTPMKDNIRSSFWH